jgi:hypothetical protein
VVTPGATVHFIRRLAASALAGAALLLAFAPGAQGTSGVTITEPVNGEVTNEESPLFAGEAVEHGGPVTLRIYAGPVAEGTPVETRSSNAPEVGETWSLEPEKPLHDGLYTARASQGAGSSLPVSFTILTTSPVVTMAQPALTPGDGEPFFTGTASETTRVTVEIYAGESTSGMQVATAIAAGTGGTWHSSPVIPALPVGRYTAVAVQRSKLKGISPGRSAPVVFEVTPFPPAPPPPQAPPSSSVAASSSSKPPPAPSLMAPFPVVRVAGVAFGGGLRLRLLSVQQAPAGALVRVRCRGHGCPAHGARRTTVAGPHGVPALVFRSFERVLRAGAVVEVFVTKPGELGKYTRLRVRRNKLPERVDECLDAAGVRPIACPAA